MFSFHENAVAFDLQNALFLAKAAEAAYEPTEQLEELVRRKWGFSKFSFVEANGTQCFVANNGRTTIVGFRGTEPTSLTDWITDVQVELVPGPLGGKVHAGFYDALSHVWRDIEQQIDCFDPQHNAPLWVTGHSLGGALGVLAVARWLEAGRSVAGLYSFGQPRTGDSAFARNFNFAFKPFAFRFVNNDDLVTRSPPRAFGYSHTGTFKYFDAEGRFQESFKWWNLFLDRWGGRLDSIFRDGDDAIADHSMTVYLQQLRKACVAAAPRTPERLIRPRRRAA